MSTFRGQGKEGEPGKKTKKMGAVREEENQESEVFWKSREERVSRRRTWLIISDVINQ